MPRLEEVQQIQAACGQLERTIEVLEAQLVGQEMNASQEPSQTSSHRTQNNSSPKSDDIVCHKVQVQIPGGIAELQCLRNMSWAKKGGSGSPVSFGQFGDYGQTSCSSQDLMGRLQQLKRQQDLEVTHTESPQVPRAYIAEADAETAEDSDATPSTRPSSGDSSTARSANISPFQSGEEPEVNDLVWEFSPAMSQKKKGGKTNTAKVVDCTFEERPMLILPGVTKRQHVPGNRNQPACMTVFDDDRLLKQRAKKSSLSKFKSFFKSVLVR